MSKEAKHTKAVINCNCHYTAACHAFAIIAWLRTVTCYKAATVEVHHHRQVFITCFRWCPYIQVKAIFAHTIRTEIHIAKKGQLHGTWAKMVCLAYASPVLHRL